MALINNREQELTTEIFVKLRNRALRRLRRLGLKGHVAEELSQNVFCKWAELRKFGRPVPSAGTAGAWVERYAYFAGVAFLRREPRRPAIEGAYAVGAAARHAATAGSLQGEDLFEFVWRVLERADPRWQRVTELRLEVWTFKEIAEKIGVCPKTVGTVMRQVREHLRAELAALGCSMPFTPLVADAEHEIPNAAAAPL
ncbi:MAG TPA: hypothetical protein VMS17_27485 [Gemmataceae bacterium]|nr:hypothetical protein [Gemmataceae bacterium]